MLYWGMDWGMGMKKLTARFVDSKQFMKVAVFTILSIQKSSAG